MLEAAATSGDLTREGLKRAAATVGEIDFDSMQPAADWSRPESVPRHAVISRFDPAAPTGAVLERDFFVGPTAAAHAFERPCTETD